MKKWIVDGMNVIGSKPDGWWRDRRGAMRRLAERLDQLASDSGDRVTVVFDGRPFDVDVDDIEVVFAPRRGPNAADDEIARIVAEDPDPGSLTVVTSDRDLVERVRAQRADVTPSRSFRARLDDVG